MIFTISVYIVTTSLVYKILPHSDCKVNTIVIKMKNFVIGTADFVINPSALVISQNKSILFCIFGGIPYAK